MRQQCVAFGHQNSASQGASVSEHISPCLDKSKTPAVAIECATVRRLTPTECERLQGFPDGWTAERRKLTLDGNRWITGETEPQADSPRYKQMGNAVTVNVAEWLGQKIQGATK
jgi:DNA (cytosine-5)-methyltransferase 1